MDCQQADLRPSAAVLLGPTGSGKTPLGQLLEARGLWGWSCVHFDFGAQLRALAAGTQNHLPGGPADAGGFTAQEIDFIRGVLSRGALLEDQHFPLARKILLRFLAQTGTQGQRWIILNGLPRHVGQAEGIGQLLDVRAVIELACPAETVLERIRNNIGGDRTARADDDLPSVARRLATYQQRTAPLVEYYRNRGVLMVAVAVDARSTVEDLWQAVHRQRPAGAPPVDRSRRSLSEGVSGQQSL